MHEGGLVSGGGGTGGGMTLTEPPPTAPSIGVVVIQGRIETAAVGRLQAELRGRIEVGTQVLVVDVRQAQFIGPSGLGVLADAARQLREERSGSVVLRNATAALLQQLRMLRIDHMFELEI